MGDSRRTCLRISAALCVGTIIICLWWVYQANNSRAALPSEMVQVPAPPSHPHVSPPQAPPAPALLPDTKIWNASDIAGVQAAIRRGSASQIILNSLQVAIDNAEQAMKHPLKSVMDKPFSPPNGDKHFYLSISKFYWPCHAPPPGTNATLPRPCDQRTGIPYTRYDGQANPAMALYDHDALLALSAAVTALGIGFFFTGNETYAQHATDLLTVWFLDDATAMAPNLEFAQYVPGRFESGLHGGIIDVHHWPIMIDAIALMRESRAWTRVKDMALRRWFAKFTTWLVTSKHGIKERSTKNNHGVWYDVTLSGCALYGGNTSVAKEVATTALEQRVNKMISPDGILPEEITRTRSFSYFEFCTDALWILADLSVASGVYLSHELNGAPSRLKTLMDFLQPFVTQRKKWQWTQIIPFFPPQCNLAKDDQCIGRFFPVLRRAANAYQHAPYEAAIATLPGVNHLADIHNLLIPPHVHL